MFASFTNTENLRQTEEQRLSTKTQGKVCHKNRLVDMGSKKVPLTAQIFLVRQDEQQRVERERERESSVAAMHVETLPGLASALHKVP